MFNKYKSSLIASIITLTLVSCSNGIQVSEDVASASSINQPTIEVFTSTPTSRPPTVTAIPAATQTPVPTPTSTLIPFTRTPSFLGQARVLAHALNVRSGPGLHYEPLSTLYRNDEVAILQCNLNDKWYRVAFKGVPIGWISASTWYVEVISGSGCTTDR